MSTRLLTLTRNPAMHTCTCIYICIASISIRIYMDIFHTHSRTRTHTHTHSLSLTITQIYLQSTSIRNHIHTCIHTQTRARTHTHTHTHTLKRICRHRPQPQTKRQTDVVAQLHPLQGSWLWISGFCVCCASSPPAASPSPAFPLGHMYDDVT